MRPRQLTQHIIAFKEQLSPLMPTAAVLIILSGTVSFLLPIWLHRLSRYQQFKDFQRRILVATNLFGRGMDIERVNIVFNYDMPEDSDTYLHRVRIGEGK